MVKVQLRVLTIVSKLLTVAMILVAAFSSARASCPLSGFAAPRSYPVFQNPRDIGIGDFNGDGLPDVVVANDGANKISLLLSNGTGTFSAAGSFSTGTRPVALVVADFNNDSKLDVATANYNSADVSILLGNGAGGFAPVTNISTGTQNPSVIIAGRLNSDVNQDLVVAHFDGTLSIMLGDGFGGFSAPIGNTKPVSRPVSLAMTDFNIDGNADLAIVGQFDSNVWIVLGNGTGGFAAASGYLAGNEPTELATADFNNDGKPDLAVSIYASKLGVLLNNGDGSFGSPAIYSVAGGGISSVVTGDFNNDGENDLAVGHNTGVSVRFGTGAGGFGTAANLTTSNGPVYLATEDFNGDGSSDLAVAAYSASSIVFLLNNGTGSFAATAAPQYPVGDGPDSIVKADFNNDGKLDLAVANRNSNDVSVVLGNGTGGFGVTHNFSVGAPPSSNVSNGPMSIASGDFNGDSNVDLVTANFTGGSVSILLGDGMGNFPSPTKINVGSGYPWFVAVADFNGDSKSDLVISRDGYFNNISILFGNGTGGFGAPVDIAGVFGPRPLAVGDFNADSKPDLAVGNQLSNDISILLNDGAGSLSTGVHYASGGISHPSSIVVADFTGDGKLDLVVASDFADSIGLLAGNGTGAFTAPIYFAVGDAPTGLAVGDFSGDGLPDVAVANSNSGSVSLLLGNAAGSFSGVANYDTGFLTTLAAGDFNSDGKLDLATDAIRILINNCIEAASTSLPSLSVNDVTVNEESGTSSFSVTLSASSSQPVAVQYYLSGGSAVKGSDFQAVSGTLNFLPGETNKTVVVPIVNDSLNEFTETFSLNLHHPINATIKKRFGIGSITDTDPEPSIVISDRSLNEGNSGTAIANFAVNLSSPSGKLITVTYSTADGTATAATDYQSASNSALSIAAGLPSKTIAILINGDTSIEQDETFFVNLANPRNASLADAQAIGTIINDDSNQIDQADFFVHQHYVDFLNREPDASGLAFWSNQITECQQPGATCSAAVRRINVSAAFFLSIEFQETGYLVERLYKAAYGDASGTSNFGPTHQLAVPIVRLNEFLPDSQQIGNGLVVGQPGWEQVLENNKVAFILQFVQRSRFTSAFPTTLTPAQFVDALFTNAGVTPSASERTSIINEFGGAGNSADYAARGRALRRVAENATLNQAEKNKAFVLMQYFGYLRRNPNDPQDTDYSGYDFWLTKLNEFNGNFVNADMVQAFIDSGEYRGRFGP